MNTKSSTNKKGSERRNPYFLPLVVLAGLIIAGALAASLGTKQNDLPDTLRGVWKTDESGHSDRFLELSLVSVSFGTGNGTVSTGFIQKVAVVPDGSRTLYTVTYRDDEGDRELSFYYEPADATLRLKNQSRAIWRRVVDN